MGALKTKTIRLAQEGKSMRYTCHYCGNPQVSSTDRFCARCGAPQPKRAPAARFFLSILYALILYAVMFLVQNAVVTLYALILQNQLSFSAFYSSYWSVFSQYYLPVLIGADVLLLLLYFSFYTLRGKHFGQVISLSKMPIAPAAVIFAGGAAFQVIVSVTISFLSQYLPVVEEYGVESSRAFSLFGDNFLLQLFYIAVAAPILEEVVFRGLIYTRLRRAMPVPAALILSSLLFGVAHGNLVQFVYATLSGLLLGWLFEKYHSIWASVLFHMAFNGASLLLVYFPFDALLFYALLCICAAVLLFMFYFVCKKPSSGSAREEETQQERNPL